MLIIGCGNRERSDDGAGTMVAQRLRQLGIDTHSRAGEATDLIEAWKGADDVIIVDAVVTGAPVGTVHVLEGWQPLSTVRTTASTHGLGVAEAIGLAHVLNRLPARLRVYGIEGGRFDSGDEISPEVQRAIEEVVQRIITDVKHAIRQRSAQSSQQAIY